MKKLFIYFLALFATLLLWSFLLALLVHIVGEDAGILLQLIATLFSFAGAYGFFRLLKTQLPPWYDPNQDKPDDPEKLQESFTAIKNSLSSRKPSTQYKDDTEFSPYSHYDPVEARWRIVGTNHEDRAEYILKNQETIRLETELSRKFALDKDPNAIAAVHNGKIIGFIAKEHAAILAPVFDKYPDKIRYSFNVWIGKKGQLIGLFVRIHTRFKVAKGDLNAAVEKCKELAYKEG